MKSRYSWIYLGALCILVVMVSSCSTPSDDSSVKWPSSDTDVAFWTSNRIDGDEVEGYDDLNDMVDSSTAVVIGQVRSIDTGRVIVDPEVPEDRVAYPALNVEVIKLLAGDLPVVSDDGMIVVEPLGGASLGQSPPEGAVVIFLRHKGELYERHPQLDGSEVAAGDKLVYRWVSSDGLFIEKDGKALNPLVERHQPDATIRAKPTEQLTDAPSSQTEDDHTALHHRESPIVAEFEQLPIAELVSEIEQSAD